MMDAALSSVHDGSSAAPRRGLIGRLPNWMRSRWALLLALVSTAGVGLVLGWPWLVAAGLAPLVLASLPCVAMCAAGLCMMGKSDGQSCSTRGGSVPDAQQGRQDA